MCWDITASASFSCLFLVINLYYFLRRPKYWKEYLLFGTFYLIMELFQTFQWIYGNVYPNHTSYGEKVCDSTNQLYTQIASILIWAQPVLYSYIGLRTASQNRIYFFKIYLPVCLLILAYSIISLIKGLETDTYYYIGESIFGSSTCTNKGLTSHLVWRFKPLIVDYHPNYLTYLLLCSLSFLLYENVGTKIIGFGWFIALVLTKIILKPTLIEVASSWCLLSIFGNLTIFLFIYCTAG